jgi:excisionase family DNA binding protein
MIIAPIASKKGVENETDESTESRTVRGFRAVPVFDVSQTDGKPLPQITQRLSGDDPTAAFRRLQVVAGDLGFGVHVEDFEGTANGDCTFQERRIRVRAGLQPAQQVKTLAHEIAHALLHNPERIAERPVGRQLAELEAESVAYVTCQELGIDSGEYSFGYIAHWAGDGEQAVKGIEASAAQIQHAAHCVLTALESTQTQPPEPQAAAPPVKAPQARVADLRDEITSVIPVGRGGMDWPEPIHTVNGQPQPSLLLTVAEACADLRISRPQLYILANKQHVIEMVHIGRACRIPRASLESYFNSLRQTKVETQLASHPEPELES